MPKYVYTVKNSVGQVCNGALEAENEARMRRRLEEQGLEVLKMREVGQWSWPLVVGLILAAIVMYTSVVWLVHSMPRPR